MQFKSKTTWRYLREMQPLGSAWFVALHRMTNNRISMRIMWNSMMVIYCDSDVNNEMNESLNNGNVCEWFKIIKSDVMNDTFK